MKNRQDLQLNKFRTWDYYHYILKITCYMKDVAHFLQVQLTYIKKVKI